MGIAHHLAALAALVICEEDETALVAALQEHDARGHAPIGRRGRKRHGFGVGLLGAHGFIEPLFKLSDRVAGHLAFIEGLRDVFVAQMRYLARYIFHALRSRWDAKANAAVSKLIFSVEPPHPHGCRSYSVTITAPAPITVESTTSTTSTESTPAASAWRAILPGTGLVNGQSSSINL